MIKNLDLLSASHIFYILIILLKVLSIFLSEKTIILPFFMLYLMIGIKSIFKIKYTYLILFINILVFLIFFLVEKLYFLDIKVFVLPFSIIFLLGFILNYSDNIKPSKKFIYLIPILTIFFIFSTSTIRFFVDSASSKIYQLSSKYEPNSSAFNEWQYHLAAVILEETVRFSSKNLLGFDSIISSLVFASYHENTNPLTQALRISDSKNSNLSIVKDVLLGKKLGNTNYILKIFAFFDLLQITLVGYFFLKLSKNQNNILPTLTIHLLNNLIHIFK